jgi:hypothetical protein
LKVVEKIIIVTWNEMMLNGLFVEWV